MEKELRIIISGGGTGGHIFPAVSIANAIIELRPDRCRLPDYRTSDSRIRPQTFMEKYICID